MLTRQKRKSVETSEKHDDYDYIIIGGGVMGVAAADHLTSMNSKNRVLLLEAGPSIAPDYGSSGGDGRIMRYAYTEQMYIDMSKMAMDKWHDLEGRSGCVKDWRKAAASFGIISPDSSERASLGPGSLLVPTGGIDIGFPSCPVVADLEAAYNRNGFQYDSLSAKDANGRFPQFSIDENRRVLYQKDYSILLIKKIISAMADMASRRGAKILTHAAAAPAPTFDHDNRLWHVSVPSKSTTFSASKLIVTAGAWTSQLLAPFNINIPLAPSHESLYYLPTKDNRTDTVVGTMPAFIDYSSVEVDGSHVYGLPAVPAADGGLNMVKIGRHHAGQSVSSTDLDDLIKTYMKPNYRTDASNIFNYASRFLPSVDVNHVDKKSVSCMYQNSPDYHFIIDSLRNSVPKKTEGFIEKQMDNLVFATGFSGHGFKFAPVVAGMISHLVNNDCDESFDNLIKNFSASRFISGNVTRRLCA